MLGDDKNEERLEEKIIRRKRNGQRQWEASRMRTAKKGIKSLRGIDVPII